MANLLQNHFVQSFSDPNATSKQNPSFTVHELSSILDDFLVTASDFHAAVDEVSANSSCSDSTIPALILKECKFELTEPFLLMWNESLNTGIIPEIQAPSNYSSTQKGKQSSIFQLPFNIPRST